MFGIAQIWKQLKSTIWVAVYQEVLLTQGKTFLDFLKLKTIPAFSINLLLLFDFRKWITSRSTSAWASFTRVQLRIRFHPTCVDTEICPATATTKVTTSASLSTAKLCHHVTERALCRKAMQHGIIPLFSTVYFRIMPASRNFPLFWKLCWRDRHKPMHVYINILNMGIRKFCRQSYSFHGGSWPVEIG